MGGWVAFLVVRGHVCGVCGVVLACGNAGVTRSDEWFAAVEVKRTDAPSCIFACGLGLVGTDHETIALSE
jgi:hypothetical protein